MFHITDPTELGTILNTKCTMVCSARFVHFYVDRTSGLLQDIILSKMSNSFSAVIPTSNSTSLNSTFSASRRRDLARDVDKYRYYYRSTDCSSAWLNCFQNALGKIPSPASTTGRNVRRHYSDIALPKFKDGPSTQSFIYNLGFSVLEVCSMIRYVYVYNLSHTNSSTF